MHSLDSQQCALLLDLEALGSVRALAERWRRDVSAVNRQLQRMAKVAPVLEKQNGRWIVSAVGRELNECTRESLRRQQMVLTKRPSLRIAAEREFATVILAPRLGELLDLAQMHHVSVLTTGSAESLLLSRQADIAFAEGRPEDPAVRFKSVKLAEYEIVASREFSARHRGQMLLPALLDLPYVQYSQARAARVMNLAREPSRLVATFDDLAATRAACLAGLGWSVLPAFGVASPLQRIEAPRLVPASYGVWWLRDRKGLEAWVERATTFLGTQTLG